MITMGRLNTYEIFLLNQYGEVECGSTLRGQIVLDCSEDMEVKEVIVQCYGKCHVELIDFRTSAPLVDVHNGALSPPVVNEIYMNESVKCFPTEIPEESSDPSRYKILPKGLNIFDFEFEIPSTIPPTFDGRYGYIRYLVRAIVHFPDNIEYNIRYFKVLPILDLNCLLNVESATEEEGETEVISFFKNLGNLKAKMSLPKRGYVPGDLVPVQLNIDNNTTKDITRATLKLKMITMYQMNFQKHSNEKILAVSHLSPICAGYTFQGCDRQLRIPKDATVSYIFGCRHIHVKYSIELYIRPALLCLTSLHVSTKIVVGTVPVNYERELASLMLREPPPSYEDLPPSYGDAIRYFTSGAYDEQAFTQESGDTYLCSHDDVDDGSDDGSVDGSDDGGVDGSDDDTEEEGDGENDDDSCQQHELDPVNETNDLSSNQRAIDLLQEELKTENLLTCPPDMLTAIILSNLDQLLSIVNNSSKSVFSTDRPKAGDESKTAIFSKLLKFLQRLSPFFHYHPMDI